MFDAIVAIVFFVALIAALIDLTRWAANARPLSEIDRHCAEIDRQLDLEGR